MKISKLITQLEEVQNEYGDIEVALQDAPNNPEVPITAYESFFVVVEDYPDDGPMCNMRWWPY